MLKHWYKITIYYCPVCFSEQRDKERVYNKPRISHHWVESYDYCNEWGG